MSPRDKQTPAPTAEEAGASKETSHEANPRDALADDMHQTEADRGSHDYDDPDRPRWDADTKLVRVHDYNREDGSYSLSKVVGKRADGEKAILTARRCLEKPGDRILDREWPEGFYKFSGLTNYKKGAGGEPDLLYALDHLVREMANRPADFVCVTEGEKDADTLRELGFIATTNPNGALKWSAEYNTRFAGRDVVAFIDNDDNGEARGGLLHRHLGPVAKSLKIVKLPGLRRHGDVTDWLNSGHSKDDLLKAIEDTPEGGAPGGGGSGVQLEDFHALMPAHTYIFAPSSETWPSTSVNSRIPPVPLFDRNGAPVLDDEGEQVLIAANKWLDQNRPVEQMTWAPGEDRVIRDRLIAEGGWIHRPGCNVFNLYRPPSPSKGDPTKAGAWIDHVRRVYPGDAEHIMNYFAHRVQRPEEKINHALVMGGAMGVGKDTIVEPVKGAVGHWNFAEVSPQHMLGRFNGFVKSVILRVSEARDLGDVDRFAFYDHMKAYTAAPPDVLRVDEKFMREYSVFNVCGVIITSNHKTNGIFLPADDRRHYVAWSELVKEDFEPGYWDRLWRWYADGGMGHVAAFLAQKDISAFQPKAPPPKTHAFWDIVASNSAPEDAELTDALEKLRWPEAVTLTAIAKASEPDFRDWVKDRKNSRKVPHKMEECGYKPVRNPSATSGRWKVDGRDVVIYTRKELSVRDAIIAAEKRVKEGNNVPF